MKEDVPFSVWEHKCPVCHKTFYISDVNQWVYKWRPQRGPIRYYCSYSCKRKSEKGKRT